MTEEEEQERHCDNYPERLGTPNCLRWFIFINRLPATLKCLATANDVDPKLWASYEGEWWRVVMASRMGDVGITQQLDADHGYTRRVYVDELFNFTDQRPKNTAQGDHNGQ